MIASMPEPYRPDFATLDDYLLAWYTWAAIERDNRLTDAEREASTTAQIECVRARP